MTTLDMHICQKTIYSMKKHSIKSQPVNNNLANNVIQIYSKYIAALMKLMSTTALRKTVAGQTPTQKTFSCGVFN